MQIRQDDQALQKLIQQIAPQSTLLRVWPLSGGISASMLVMEISHSNGHRNSLILRMPGEAALSRNPHAAQDEYNLLEMAHAQNLRVPAPVFVDESKQLFPSPYLVIEYLEGKIEFSPEDVENYAFQMALHLAQIHNLDCARLDLSYLEAGEREFADSLGERPAQMDDSLEEGRVRGALEAVWPLPSRNPEVLLHGDYWPGNIIWRDQQLAGIIDWEDAECGDPLKDLAISRLDLLWILGKDAMILFTEHYQSMTTFDFTLLPYWDLCAVLRFIRMAGPQIENWAAFFAPYGRKDITEQSIREHVRLFVEQAFEKLDL